MPVNAQAKLKSAAEKLDGSLAGKGGDAFQKQLDNRKFLLKSAKLMDTEEGRSKETMEAAFETMQTSFDDYYKKLDKASKADAKVKRLAMKPMMAFGLELQKVFDAYSKATLKLVDDKGATKDKGKGVADAAAEAAEKKKLDAAIKDVKDSRAKHLAVTVATLKKMTAWKAQVEALHGNAFKTLAQAEKAGTTGDAAGAAAASKVIAKMAKDGEKINSDSSDFYDKALKPFFNDRLRFTADTMQKAYDLTDKDAKLYKKEMLKQVKTFSTAVNTGTACMNLVVAGSELADEMSSMAEQAAAFAKGGDALRAHVLKDLTEDKGKTSCAVLHKTLDPMLQQAGGAQKYRDDVLAAIKRYNDGGKTDALKQAIDANYSKIEKGRAKMEPLWKRSEASMKNAFKRVPKSLANDAKVKAALKRMGTITVAAKVQYNAAIKCFDEAKAAYAKI